MFDYTIYKIYIFKVGHTEEWIRIKSLRIRFAVQQIAAATVTERQFMQILLRQKFDVLTPTVFYSSFFFSRGVGEAFS